jgi:hypothetical protein
MKGYGQIMHEIPSQYGWVWLQFGVLGSSGPGLPIKLGAVGRV